MIDYKYRSSALDKIKEGVVEKFISWMFPTVIDVREEENTYGYKSGWFSSIYSYSRYIKEEFYKKEKVKKNE